MKASLRWLRSLVPALEAGDDEIARWFDRGGLEVTDVQTTGAGLESFIVGAVREILSDGVVTVDTGTSTVRVPCGKIGEVTVGARVGLTRDGVLCSESDLGIGPLHGAAILDHDMDAGTSVADAIPAAQDTILSLGVGPRRSDVLGHVGLARELAALANVPFGAPATDAVTRVVSGTFDAAVLVDVQDFDGSPHFGAVVLEGVQVESSPCWIRARLHALGLASSCNVIDVANLVMLELGRPVRAYDLDRLEGGRVVVRRAKRGEAMNVDGAPLRLGDDDLVLCDVRGPIALAGIVDGDRVAIHGETKRVLLTCGTFEPSGIARTAKRHGLETELSVRCGRGVDPTSAPEALAQVGALMTRLAHAAAVPGSSHALKERFAPRQVQVRGETLAGGQTAQDILVRLGFEVIPLHGQDGALLVSIPGFRPDLRSEDDVLGEVARIRRSWLSAAERT